MSDCIGFGKHDGRCENEAGSTHSALWCQRCDDLRMAHLDAQMMKIAARFDATPSPGEQDERPEGETT